MSVSKPPKPANQGGMAKPNVAAPKVSDAQPGGTPTGSVPMKEQPARKGVYTPGKGGTGTTHSSPKPL